MITKFTIAILLLLSPLFSIAQGYKVNFANNADNKIIVTASQGNFTIKGYKGNEVRVKARTTEANNVPEKAKGLKSLYNSAEDNTGLGLSVVQEGKLLKILKASRNENDYEIEVPANVSVSVEQVNWGDANLEISNINGEIEITSTTGDMVLRNISGPVVANSVSGNLTADFSSIRQGKPTAISLVSGDIDLRMPSDSKVDFKLQSIAGEIYTDLDIVSKNKNPEQENLRQIGGGYTIQGANNGGGTEYSLNTVSGNIFIRKKP